MKAGIDEYLGGNRNYKPITYKRAVQLQYQLRYYLQVWLGKYMEHDDGRERLTPNEVVYLKRAQTKYPEKLRVSECL